MTAASLRAKGARAWRAMVSRISAFFRALDDALPCADDTEDVALMRGGLRSYRTVSSVWVNNVTVEQRRTAVLHRGFIDSASR
jgi:hypothetical protein